MSTTLTDRVYAILANEQTDPILSAATEPLPRGDNGYCKRRHLKYAEWGMVVGLAYGIARGEDAFESAESVTERAIVAARGAWDRWAVYSPRVVK